MAGQVVEIRTVDLRCSLEEAAEVVASSMGLDFVDQVVAEIHHKTMGWMVGIRLAAQTVAASPDTTRSVDQELIVGCRGKGSGARIRPDEAAGMGGGAKVVERKM
mgnify:CR=1 FL=1